MNEFLLLPRALQLKQTEAELLRCNEATRPYGLWLSRTDAARLAARRFESLRDAGRVEFGGSVLPLLISAFCDSPDLQQADYADALDELQALFYMRKQEAMERLSDEELISALRTVFDRAHGSLEVLRGVDAAALFRIAHGSAPAEEFPMEDSDDE